MFPNRPVKILLIEDEEYDVRRIQNTIRPFRDKLLIKKVVSSGEAAVAELERQPAEVDVVVMDFQIAGGLSGERLIQKSSSWIPLSRSL